MCYKNLQHCDVLSCHTHELEDYSLLVRFAMQSDGEDGGVFDLAKS